MVNAKRTKANTGARAPTRDGSLIASFVLEYRWNSGVVGDVHNARTPRTSIHHMEGNCGDSWAGIAIQPPGEWIAQRLEPLIPGTPPATTRDVEPAAPSPAGTPNDTVATTGSQDDGSGGDVLEPSRRSPAACSAPAIIIVARGEDSSCATPTFVAKRIRREVPTDFEVRYMTDDDDSGGTPAAPNARVRFGARNLQTGCRIDLGSVAAERGAALHAWAARLRNVELAAGHYRLYAVIPGLNRRSPPRLVEVPLLQVA
ncbi:MAG TPA: hypothetical protein VMU33_08170 [Burkholderiaceae bacterium]|nr:hypothetical protein [Burkholderiaceae bacterium]